LLLLPSTPTGLANLTEFGALTSASAAAAAATIAVSSGAYVVSCDAPVRFGAIRVLPEPGFLCTPMLRWLAHELKFTSHGLGEAAIEAAEKRGSFEWHTRSGSRRRRSSRRYETSSALHDTIFRSACFLCRGWGHR
jgi:hypothetical protein